MSMKIETRKVQSFSGDQKKFLNDFFAAVKDLSKGVDKDSIEPANSNVIIKLGYQKRTIFLPSHQEQGMKHDSCVLHKISDQVAEKKPVFANKIGWSCHVAPMFIQHGLPCFHEDDENYEYIYYSISAEHIAYFFKELEKSESK